MGEASDGLGLAATFPFLLGDLAAGGRPSTRPGAEVPVPGLVVDAEASAPHARARLEPTHAVRPRLSDRSFQASRSSSPDVPASSWRSRDSGPGSTGARYDRDVALLVVLHQDEPLGKATATVAVPSPQRHRIDPNGLLPGGGAGSPPWRGSEAAAPSPDPSARDAQSLPSGCLPFGSGRNDPAVVAARVLASAPARNHRIPGVWKPWKEMSVWAWSPAFLGLELESLAVDVTGDVDVRGTMAKGHRRRSCAVLRSPRCVARRARSTAISPSVDGSERCRILNLDLARSRRARQPRERRARA